MFDILKSNLGRRILLLVGMSMLLILGALVVSGWLAVRQSSERVFHERQALAQTSGRFLDYILQQNFERLNSVQFAPGVNIADSDMGPEKIALHNAYLSSIFDGGVFITNQQGIVLWIEPFRSEFVDTDISNYPAVYQSLSNGKPMISNVVTIEPGGQKVIFMVTPLRSQEGKIVGLAGGQISINSRTLSEFTQFIELGEISYVDVTDSNGVVLTSNDTRRILMNNEEIINQNGTQVTVTAPLSLAPWSVVVRQSEAQALASVRIMEQRFIIFGLSSLIIALFLSWGMARSLIKPIGELTAAAHDISNGDLSKPIPQLGKDEIGELSRGFDAMRIALKESLDEIQQWNRELEAKVAERTRQLEDSYREIERKEIARGELLRKVLTVQEEERKRIARELHDETSQSLVGLVMRLEAVASMPDESIGKVRSLLADVKNLAVRTIDSVHNIIFDLRPSVLDDLGLLPALRWYVENRLEEAAIESRVEVTGEEKKLPPEVEIAVFRAVQEAITNIIKHAEARNVVLSVEFKGDFLRVEVEDDGKGFDVEAINLQSDEMRGLGLLGIEERVTILGGKFNIESQPEHGTHLTIEVPLDTMR
ncbi:ATP-binding protein [Chloroflexota bacterium]